MRRRARFLALLLPWVLLAQQQERAATSIDLPADPDIGIYYRQGSGWEEMLPEVVNWKTGGVLKQLVTAGVVKGDYNGHINGVHSRNWLTSPTVVIYALEGVAVTEYQLLHLHENSDSREFRTITGGVMHASGGATRDVIPFEGRRLARGVYEVLMPKLAAGEYGFLAPGATVSRNSASIGKIYTFRVEVPKGTALTRDAQGEVTLGPAKLTAKPVSVQPPAADATIPSGAQASDVGGSARLPAASTSSQPSLKPMTNEDVMALKLAGFSDDLIIARIKAAPANFKIDTEDIIALKKSNLSEPVIQAMMAAASPFAGPTPSGTPTRTVPALAARPTVNGPHTAAGQDAPASSPQQPDQATRGTSEPSKGLFTKLKGAFSSSSDERKPRTNQTAPPEPAVPPELALTSLTVLSKPAGALILIDGYHAGYTPAVVKLVPGTYKLTLKAAGLPDYSQQITVEPGQVRSFGVALDGSK
jgi:hypothetical protein